MPDIPFISAGDSRDFGNRLIGPPPSRILETEIKGDLSLYDPAQEKVLVLNGTATDVWLLCDGQHTGNQIVALAAAVHGQNPATIHTDVEDTIRHFLEEGFLPQP